MSYMGLLGALLLVGASVALWKGFHGRWGRWGKLIGTSSAAAASVAALTLVLMFLMVHAMCGEYLFAATQSPDHLAVVQITEFDCGATTPFTTQVRLRSTRTLLDRLRPSWSVVFTIVHDPRLVSTVWVGPRELTIRYPIPYRDRDWFKCDSRWGEVKINCESYTPDLNNPLPNLPEPNHWLW